MQHGSSCTHYRMVLPFSHSILLWSVRNNQLPLYPLLSTILIKCTRSILTSIVWPKYLDLLSSLVLHKSFELLEPKKDFLWSLASKEIGPGLPRKVINESDVILISCQIGRRHGTTQMWMYQLKHSLWSGITAWKSSLGVFSQSTPHYTSLCSVLNSVNPVTMYINILKYGWCRWSILLFHSSQSSLPLLYV